MLVKGKNLPIEKVILLLNKYAEQKLNGVKGVKRKWILDCVAYNFDSFLAFVSKETGLTFKKKPLSNRRKKKMQNGDFFDGCYDGTIESVFPHWKD